MTDTRTRIDELLAGLEGVTPGPWESRETRVYFPQPAEGGISLHATPNGAAIAAHIARCDPDFIRSIASLAKVGLDAQWRDIKTDSPPKDEPIFLWPSSSGRSFYGYWNDGSGSWSRYLDIEYRPQEPTHWQPLPTPPASLKQTETI